MPQFPSTLIHHHDYPNGTRGRSLRTRDRSIRALDQVALSAPRERHPEQVRVAGSESRRRSPADLRARCRRFRFLDMSESATFTDVSSLSCPGHSECRRDLIPWRHSSVWTNTVSSVNGVPQTPDPVPSPKADRAGPCRHGASHEGDRSSDERQLHKRCRLQTKRKLDNTCVRRDSRASLEFASNAIGVLRAPCQRCQRGAVDKVGAPHPVRSCPFIVIALESSRSTPPL
ncbi:hypothetical protein EDF46_2702 [Frondihabitans sp. PhB188]|nr:hypothetical protein EDF46_2702 [Frondihabitans sp. PhB188]